VMIVEVVESLCADLQRQAILKEFLAVCAQHNVAMVKEAEMSCRQEAGRHSPHDLVIGPARRSGFCVRTPSLGGTTSTGCGAHRKALQPDQNLESARGRPNV